MKVALITETFLPQINGVTRTMERIIKYLEKQGHEVLVITIGEGEDHYSNTKVLRIPAVKFFLYEEMHLVEPQDRWLKKLLKSPLTQIPVAALLSLLPVPHEMVARALVRFKPDLIHLATPMTLGAVGAYYVNRLKLPCLATYHTDIASYAENYHVPFGLDMVNALNTVIYGRADRVLAPSPSSKRQLEDIGIGNVGVFGRGVDSGLFSPDRSRKAALAEHGLDPEAITIAYAGRLAEEKSLPVVIKAFKNLNKKFKNSEQNIQLLLIGDGPIRDKVARELHGTPHAFTGFKKGEEYAELQASADIFAFPSQTETFGQVVLEAMSSGLAVVGFDSPGVRDQVIHEETGLLVNLDIEFENALETLVLDAELRTKYGATGRQEALKRSWDAILGGLVEEYEALV